MQYNCYVLNMYNHDTVCLIIRTVLDTCLVCPFVIIHSVIFINCFILVKVAVNLNTHWMGSQLLDTMHTHIHTLT